MTAERSAAPVVLREDDPRLPALLADGLRVAHRSWGARMATPENLAPLRRMVALAASRGYRVRELDPTDDDAVVALETVNRDDYPGGPATAPRPRTAASMASDRAGGTRWFGAESEGRLVAVTAVRATGTEAETDSTSVAAAHRRRGLAEAVKAASVLALLDAGVRVFRTGGAEENAASLAMNRRLGYVVDERWLTLQPA